MHGTPAKRGSKGLADDLARISNELESLRRTTEELVGRRDTLIVALIDAGRTYAEICDQCGLSRGRIAQIAALRGA